MNNIEEIIKAKSNFIICDNTKEFYLNKYEELKNNGYQVITLDITNYIDTETFNVLEYPYQLYQEGKKDLAIDIVENISKIIFYDSKLDDPFWNDMSSDLFIGTTLGLFEQKNKPTLASVYDFINSKTEIKTDDVIINRYLKSIYEAATETKLSIYSMALYYLKTLVTREFINKLLGSTSFDYHKLAEKTAIIIINYDEKTAYSKITNIFVETLKAIIINEEFPKYEVIV